MCCLLLRLCGGVMSSSRCRRIIVNWSWRFVWNRCYMMMQTGRVGKEEVRGREGVFSGMLSGRKELEVIWKDAVITRHVAERRYACER
jgi:hypothetical protein